MNEETKSNEQLLNGAPSLQSETSRPAPRRRWKKRLGIAALTLATTLAVPTLGHGQLLSVFDSIFSSIQSDIGSSLSSINQIMQQVTKLYQTTVAPLAALNQARGFVANSISSFRNSMNQIFNTPFTSAVTPGPQQFESILHSRLSTQIPSLQTSFTTNYGTIPQANTASPQDRVMMD